MALERIVECEPAYDKRDPDPTKNYGVCGVVIRFVLKGPKGAVQFMVMTDWYPPNVQEEHRKQGLDLSGVRPMGADVGYHSRIPRYEGQEDSGPCVYLDGRNCYYDGSGLRADGWVKNILLPKGSDGVWEALEAEYHANFDGDPEPPPPWLEALENSGLTAEQKETVKVQIAALVEEDEETWAKTWREQMDGLRAKLKTGGNPEEIVPK